jgi:hypothetical protein
MARKWDIDGEEQDEMCIAGTVGKSYVLPTRARAHNPTSWPFHGIDVENLRDSLTATLPGVKTREGQQPDGCLHSLGDLCPGLLLWLARTEYTERSGREPVNLS